VLLEVIPLKEENLEEAAALVSSRYKNLCEQEPHLPHRYKEVSNLMPLLQNIMRAAPPGVAAIQDGQLVGFLTGWLMPDFRGKRSVYSPEWANAADLEKSRYIYEEMYRRLAADWIAGKYVAHYITMFANDIEAVRAWHWLGFGMTAVDAVRGLQPIQGGDDRIDVRRAGPQDLEQVMELNDGLRQHVKGSPDFFIAQELSKEYLEQWIQDPDRVIWLAYVNEEPVAFIRIGPARDDVCTIICDEKTTSIYGAFTKEAMRGKGIGTALLEQAIKSARSTGYERCAVDFEPMNLLGTRFWLRHDFRPVCLSLLRYIDEGVL
jgi:GNAT superfamily N-acetyltransferase